MTVSKVEVKEIVNQSTVTTVNQVSRCCRSVATVLSGCSVSTLSVHKVAPYFKQGHSVPPQNTFPPAPEPVTSKVFSAPFSLAEIIVALAVATCLSPAFERNVTQNEASVSLAHFHTLAT